MDTVARVATRAMGAGSRKERFEIILEPLQAITQLAMLAFCPVGTKLSIANNILYVQPPGWGQTIQRTYGRDQRDDLFYLFRMIARYHKFYGFLRDGKGVGATLFSLLTDLSKRGLDNITQTYALADEAALLHTLKMYRTMLDSPELLEGQIAGGHGAEAGDAGIDSVFINVRDLYTSHHYDALYHILTLARDNPADHGAYLDAINALLAPTTRQIKKWISANIVF
tara:strand:- start:144 stop:821 length:678 start_codon:yes stop_codon:yes gene_type:complete